ncbi:papain-like cysteine protease family protein [Sphingopyxis sp.]|uniref:papain-like cysteine protease family protein n=1 Tax=Sphingopyxis sp. TaxID=1908224 RepID=UPI002ED7DD09
MTAQIRPNRMEVSDRFPMVGFAIKSDAPGVEAEVVLASDINLFKPENRTMRSAANFYSSREHGLLQIPNGEGIFALPPEVLARFIGQDRLFFGLATGKVGNGGLVVDALPRDGSPYVSLRSFSGRTLRRSFGARAAPRPPVLDWAGDSARPGGEPASGTQAPVTAGTPLAPPSNGAAPPAPNYDDGFGPMPEIPAREARAFTRGLNAEENLIDFPEEAVRMGPVIEPNPEAASAPASAMVAGAEDYAKARRLARDFSDLFTWRVPPAVASAVSARGFSIQTIESAAGDLNLDFYKVDIVRFPDGWDAPRLLEYFITNINSFVDTGNTEFKPYDSSDTQRLASADKVGTAFELDIVGPDDAAVVISARQQVRWGEFYAVTTIEAPNTGSHPVSGHRQFGYYQTANGWVFYTRGADRSTAPLPGTEWIIWQGAEALWQSFQAKMVAFINGNGGEASARTPFSERFNATAVRLTYGNFGAASTSAMGLGFSAGPEAGNGPKLTVSGSGTARDRANRIGGQFADRIGQALDSGLVETTLDPLFEKLDVVRIHEQLETPAPQPLVTAQSAGWSINWDDIDPIAQPTDNGCWATTLSMLLSWRGPVSIGPEAIAQQCGKDINNGLPWGERASAAAMLGLYSVDPQCYLPEAFAGMIENYGPLYVGKMASSTNLSGHAVLVVGMYFDGANHFIRVVDPWDRPVGNPGSPGAYASTHNTGSRYIMRYEDFQAEYEMAAAGTPAYVQILYAGVPAGRTINRTTAPSGFAMALSERTDADAAQTGPGTVNLTPPPAPVARGMEVAATIAGVVLEQVISNVGDVSWTTDQFRGIKHPNDTAPASPAPFQDATAISLDWPVLSDSYIDDISAFFRIDWQHNGKSIGNVRITNIGTNDAIGWSLNVRGSIMDDNRVYDPNGCAALRITLHYYFTHVIGSDQIALCEIQIFGDGTHTKNCSWVQSSLFGVGQSRQPALA